MLVIGNGAAPEVDVARELLGSQDMAMHLLDSLQGAEQGTPESRVVDAAQGITSIVFDPAIDRKESFHKYFRDNEGVHAVAITPSIALSSCIEFRESIAALRDQRMRLLSRSSQAA